MVRSARPRRRPLSPVHFFDLFHRRQPRIIACRRIVAAMTGGEMIYIEDAGPLKQTRQPYRALQQTIERIRRRYRLYYDKPKANPGQRRRVQIGLSPAARRVHPEARIVARNGYVIPKAAGLRPTSRAASDWAWVKAGSAGAWGYSARSLVDYGERRAFVLGAVIR